MVALLEFGPQASYQDIAILCSKAVAVLSLVAWVNLGVKEGRPLDSDDSNLDEHLSKTGLSLLVLVARLIQASALVAALLSPSSMLRTPWSVSDFLVVSLGNLAGFLRVWSMQTLGDLFTFQVGIRSRHKLVTGGPYRWVRHPSYTGMVLLSTSLVLSTGFVPPLAAGTLAFLTFTALGWRMSNEERVLQQHFGEQYTLYCRRARWRLVPFVY